MLKSVTITNHLGRSLKVTLSEAEPSHGLLVKSITGIGPADATVNMSDYATNDGSEFNSARLDKRSIQITFMLVATDDCTVEQARHNTYAYFPPKKQVRLLFETDERSLYCYGRVEHNSPDIFQKQELVTIDILCPDPYFYKITDEGQEDDVVEMSIVSPAFSSEYLNPNNDSDETLKTFSTEYDGSDNVNYLFWPYTGLTEQKEHNGITYEPNPDGSIHVHGYVSPSYDSKMILTQYVYFNPDENFRKRYKLVLIGAENVVGRLYGYGGELTPDVDYPATGLYPTISISTAYSDIGDNPYRDMEWGNFYATENGVRELYDADSNVYYRIVLSVPTEKSGIEIDETIYPMICAYDWDNDTWIPPYSPGTVPNLQTGIYSTTTGGVISEVFSNEGDADTYFNCDIYFNGGIEGDIIISNENDEQIKILTSIVESLIGASIASGDEIHLETDPKRRYMSFIRNGEEINILNALDFDNLTWFAIPPGDNIINYFVTSGNDNTSVTFSYKTLYLGV